MPRGYDQDYGVAGRSVVRDQHGNAISSDTGRILGGAGGQAAVASSPPVDHLGRTLAGFGEMLSRITRATISIEQSTNKILGSEPMTDSEQPKEAPPTSVLDTLNRYVDEYDRMALRLQHVANRLETL